VLDPVGVGGLVKMAAAAGRDARSNLHIGICGEHGGDPQSIAFAHSVGLIDYVSCSPLRIPVARLAAGARRHMHTRARGCPGPPAVHTTTHHFHRPTAGA
jgi:phosphoenolpyruvate synthase/pyruvate phosphate dikinase